MVPEQPAMPDPAAPERDLAADVTTRADRETSRHPPLRFWALALAGGLVAGLASWACGEVTCGLYKPVFERPPNWNKLNGYEKADYESADLIRKKPVAEVKNA